MRAYTTMTLIISITATADSCACEEAMDSVRKGDTLSIITNLFGEEVDRVIAPFDGVVIGYWTYSVCPPHGWVYMVGKPVDGE